MQQSGRYPEAWAQVEALAAALRGMARERTLAGVEARRLCRRARRECLRGRPPGSDTPLAWLEESALEMARMALRRRPGPAD